MPDEIMQNVAGPSIEPELQDAAQSASTDWDRDNQQPMSVDPPPVRHAEPTISPNRSIIFGEHRATMQELMNAYRAQQENQDVIEKGRMFQRLEQGDPTALQQYVAGLTSGQGQTRDQAGDEVGTSMAALQEQISGLQNTLASQAVNGFTNEVNTLIKGGNFPHLQMLPGIGAQITETLLNSSRNDPNFQLNGESFASYMKNCEQWASNLTKNVYEQFQARAQTAPTPQPAPNSMTSPVAWTQPGGAQTARPFPGQQQVPSNAIPPLGGGSPGYNPGPTRPNAARDEKGWGKYIASRLSETMGQQTV